MPGNLTATHAPHATVLPLPAVPNWADLLERCPDLGVVELEVLIAAKRIDNALRRLLDDPEERRVAREHLRRVLGGAVR